MISRSLYILLFVLSSVQLDAQTQALDNLLTSEVFDHSSVAYTVRNAVTGKILYDHNGDLSLIPASTLKVVTTFSAINVLGADYRYKTKVYYQGELLDDGTLYGDIIIKGSGDPSLGSPFFDKDKGLNYVLESIGDFIIKKGIQCIEGNVVIDNSDFNSQPIHDSWQWNDIGNYYAAGSWAFNIHENLFNILFKRSNIENTSVSIEYHSPTVPSITISNKVVTGQLGSGDNAYLYTHPLKPEIEIRGSIPPGESLFKIKGAIPRPDLFFKYHLINYLNQKNISFTWIKPKPSHINREEIGTIYSAPLIELADYANDKSNNLYCESFIKSIGKKVLGNGSFENGVKTIKANLDDDLYLKQVDGSGLSMRNRVTTKFQTSFLQKQLKLLTPEICMKLLKKKKIGDSVVYLKSGSMGQVIAYTGMFDEDGELYTFSFITNAHHSSGIRIRNAFEKVLLISHDLPPEIY